MKEEIKLQANREIPITPNAYRELKRRNIAPHRMKFNQTCKAILVPTDAISTPDKLAYIVRRHYGYGTFTIMFWSKYIRNRRYNPNWECRKRICPYYARGRCKSRWSTMKLTKSKACQRNKKLLANWTKRYKLTIYEAEAPPGMEDADFRYKILYDRMSQFWFWKQRSEVKPR